MIALDIERVVHPLRVREGWGIDDREVPLAPGAPRVGQELANIGLNDLAGQLVEREVLAGPVEVRVRQIDARRLHPGCRRVHGERARVAEQVEQRLPLLRCDPRARDSMIEEQAGVDIFAERDAERVAALADRAPGRLVFALFILVPLAPPYQALAGLRERLLCVERLLGHSDDAVEPHRIAWIDSIVIDDQRAFVRVDRHRELRNISVVHAPAGDARTLRPLTEVPRVLAQPVREHICDRIRHRRCRVGSSLYTRVSSHGDRAAGDRPSRTRARDHRSYAR